MTAKTYNTGGTYISAGATYSAEELQKVDLSGLPKKFDEDDFDIVAKEAWLQGFWLNRRDPGTVSVCVESDWGDPQEVTVYRKKWSETIWKVRTNVDGEIC